MVNGELTVLDEALGENLGVVGREHTGLEPRPHQGSSSRLADTISGTRVVDQDVRSKTNRTVIGVLSPAPASWRQSGNGN